MPNAIRMKRSSTAGKVPTAGDLDLGEIAVNTADGKLFLKKSNGAETVIEVGPVVSVAGRTGTVALSKGDVGLANVDNTSDANKPVSSATQTALDGKANAAHSHALGDVANLQTSLDAKAHAQNPVFSGSVDLASGSLRQNAVTVAALAIDCAAGNYFTKTISGDSAFTFANVPAGKAYGLTLELTHAAGNVAWPASVAWPAGSTPQLTTGRKHLFVFVTDDGGTVWRAAALVDYLN